MNSDKTKSTFRKIAFRVLHPLSEKYLSRERNYNYRGITVAVFPGVFHPGFFFSTKILLKYLEKTDLRGKYVLELGAGTGLISIFASKKGAIVTSSDISLNAVRNAEKNSEMNNASIEAIHSDLFDNIPKKNYDYILINPPYYKKNPSNEKEYAWFCGDDFQYFRKLFTQLDGYFYENTNVLMVLSDDTDLESIKKISRDSSFRMEEVLHKKSWGENHFIFNIKIS